MKAKYYLLLLCVSLFSFSFTSNTIDYMQKLTGGSSKKWVLTHLLFDGYDMKVSCLSNHSEYEFLNNNTLFIRNKCNPDSMITTLERRFEVVGDSLAINDDKFAIVELTTNYIRLRKRTQITLNSDKINPENSEKNTVMELILEHK